MREERVEFGGVPGRLYDPGAARGVLLFGHGGAHSKDGERFVRLCRTYADGTGLAVVCIDAVDHGERKPAGASGGLPERWHSPAIPQMVADWRTTADALASLGPAVAYVGFSMGAIFSVRQRRPRCRRSEPQCSASAAFPRAWASTILHSER